MQSVYEDLLYSMAFRARSMKIPTFSALLIRSTSLLLLLMMEAAPLPAQNHTKGVLLKDELHQSNKPVGVMMKDRRGFTWFGTSEGLCRFDGTDAKVYKHHAQDSSSLSHNEVNAIIEDPQGSLWIGTANGLDRYNPATDNFISVDQLTLNSEKLLNRFITSLDIDDQDQIWIGTMGGGVYVFDTKTSNLTSVLNRNANGLSSFITAITIQDVQARISTRAGSYIVDTRTLQLSAPGFDNPLTNKSHETTNRSPIWLAWWAILSYVLLILIVGYRLWQIRKQRALIKEQLKVEMTAREKEHKLIESKVFFFTNISHELRTPLSLILMPLEKIAFSRDVPDQFKKSLSTAYKNASNLMKIVNELMDISKFDEVKLSLHVKYGEYVNFISEVAESFNDVAEKKNIKLSIHASSPQIYGWYDADKLEKIVRNLLSNAFKFTRDGGEIDVTVAAIAPEQKSSPQLQHLELMVRDNGIGIAADELPRIFDKFYQASSASCVEHTGSGIGLSLTQTLVNLHHGSIVVESTPGVGSTFRVCLPLTKSAYNEEELGKGNIVNVNGEKDLATSEYDHIVIDKSLGKPELLIIEDNDDMRKFLVTEFSSEFSVTEASTGEEGFMIACDMIPDLIVSDVVLPGKSGVSVCREIKEDIRTSHIPVILLTAKASTQDHIVGLEAGADVYIPKPFSIRVLQTQVTQVISTRRKLYTRYSQDAYLMPANLADNTIDKEFLQKAVDYVNNNLRNSQLSVESIAELFHISRSQVYRKIKALTGQTVVEFIRSMRLKHALTLMDEKKYNLSEVADRAGFNSLSYFTRSFKEQYGKAPSEYLEKKKS
jgi:signal transduction histidine kinase/DNA-binding response OmpR family regulator